MGIIRDLARHGKDKAVAKAMEILGEKVVSRYGTLQGLTLDSLTRSINLELMLKGEDVPVTLTIHEYRFLTEGDKCFVIIGRVSISREWMAVLAEDLLVGKQFEIPSKYAKLLEAFF